MISGLVLLLFSVFPPILNHSGHPFFEGSCVGATAFFLSLFVIKDAGCIAVFVFWCRILFLIHVRATN